MRLARPIAMYLFAPGCVYRRDVLKVDSTPTFFVNGERLKGAMSFEELDRKLKSRLKK